MSDWYTSFRAVDVQEIVTAQNVLLGKKGVKVKQS